MLNPASSLPELDASRLASSANRQQRSTRLTPLQYFHQMSGAANFVGVHSCRRPPSLPKHVVNAAHARD
eukprot:5922769-Karenia_brevis.AAC.1